MIICFITLTIHAEREKEEDYLLKFHKWRATREQSVVVTNVVVLEAEKNICTSGIKKNIKNE
jgi:hypothetical protein